MKRAIFPDSKSLQPMPSSSYVHADISGNTNNTTGMSPETTSATNSPAPETTQSVQPSSQSVPSSGKNFTFYLTWFIILLLVTCSIIFIYRSVRVRRKI